MRHYLRAALVASTAFGFSGMASGQSSSPFSGLFGGGSKIEGPVDLTITVEGDTDGLDRTIRNTSLVSGALREGRNTGQDVLAAARGDYARILGTLYAEGFYSAQIFITLDGVEAAEIAPLDAPAQVTKVRVRILPGPQFHFARAAIAPVARQGDVADDYSKGKIAGTGVIKAAAAGGISGWRDVGHAKARVAGQEIVADHNQNTVDSRIALDPGPTVTFGQLNISGQERMDPRRLRKITGFPTGTRYDPEDIETMRKRLRRTGVFSAITIDEAETLRPDNSMDVNLTVVEQKLRRIGAGFEVSNTDGALVSAYWMHRNLLGGGERLRIEGKLADIGSSTSGRDEEVTIRLDRPATLSPDTTGYVEARVAREREEDYDSDLASLALGFNYIFNDRLQAGAALQYQVSQVTDANGRTDFKVLSLPMNVVFDRRDVMTDAKRGYYLSGNLTPFKGFGDTDDGAQILGESRGFYSFGTKDRLTLAGRARVGSILGSDIENTPRDYLFFSGGGGTVRGQPYEALGAKVIIGPEGDPIKTGGMSIATVNAELRFQVKKKIGLVGFVDYGRVWSDGAFDGTSGDHAGAGVGIRYDTPIGPLRFDVAGPVGGDTGRGAQLYLGLGQAF